MIDSICIADEWRWIILSLWINTDSNSQIAQIMQTAPPPGYGADQGLWIHIIQSHVVDIQDLFVDFGQ